MQLKTREIKAIILKTFQIFVNNILLFEHLKVQTSRVVVYLVDDVRHLDVCGVVAASSHRSLSRRKLKFFWILKSEST